MLREVLESAGLQPARTAALLGLNPELFQKYLMGQREMPTSVLGLLSNVVGLDLGSNAQRKISSTEAATITPAIWYRFRGDKLVEADREFVLLIRRLGYFINELEEMTGSEAVGWRNTFRDISQRTDTQAPPRVQGIQAAKMFRGSRGLEVGATGIGDALRGNLRSMGVLVVETPIPQSELEGCCFYIGNRPTERPCVFANSHHTTWFRRNEILLHEVAHAIFDAETNGATLDFLGDQRDKLIEERADAFAQEVLVPRQVIQHVAQRNGIKWSALSPDDLARLVAHTQAEKRLILRAALEGALVREEDYSVYSNFDIAPLLQKYSQHALTAAEYLKINPEEAKRFVGKRGTTYLPGASVQLPSSYIDAVLRVYDANEISRGKAAEMLMIDEETFFDRFGDYEDI